MEETKKSKGLIWLIIILIIVILGLIGFIVYDKVLNDNKTEYNSANSTISDNETERTAEKEYKKFETNMKNSTCINMSENNYYDYDYSYEIIINDIKLNDKNVIFKYVRDYSTMKMTYFINDVEALSSDINENLLSAVCVYDDYIFATNSWEFMTGSTSIISSEGKIVKDIGNNFEYNDGIISVKDITSLNDNKGVFESYKFDLKSSQLNDYDFTSELFDCKDYSPESSIEDGNEVEKFKFAYCNY